ncbi:hypothetical protein COO60DRAFT_1534032 [Scenedesmus sp. NREL 46B-D3]|nr:hypothetical protein COO60DRAFT_1534032 [Scenedesmus sp. NREL 46B-D3]
MGNCGLSVAQRVLLQLCRLPTFQELVVTPKSVTAAQQRFTSSMMSGLAQRHARALASWGVGPEELQAVGQLLLSEHVLKLGLTLLVHVYSRYFIESGFLPPKVVQHLRAQGGSRAKGMQAAKRCSTLVPDDGAATSAAATADGTDQADYWDLGIALLQITRGSRAALPERCSSSCCCQRHTYPAHASTSLHQIQAAAAAPWGTGWPRVLRRHHTFQPHQCRGHASQRCE